MSEYLIHREELQRLIKKCRIYVGMEGIIPQWRWAIDNLLNDLDVLDAMIEQAGLPHTPSRINIIRHMENKITTRKCLCKKVEVKSGGKEKTPKLVSEFRDEGIGERYEINKKCPLHGWMSK